MDSRIVLSFVLLSCLALALVRQEVQIPLMHKIDFDEKGMIGF